MEPKLSIRGVGKEFRDANSKLSVTVLDQITFDVPSGAFVSLVGLNGSGKTTLLRIIAGLEVASRGEVLINSKRVDHQRGKVGMVFQGSALLPWLTALENIKIGLTLKRLPAVICQQRAAEYLRTFGLEECGSKYPHELSGGTRQKVALARAIAADPEIILMDEPFSSLDCRSRERMQSFLTKLVHQRGDTVLFVTHDVDEAILLSDTIVVISQKPARVIDVIPVDNPRPRTISRPENIAIRHRVMDSLRKKLHVSALGNTVS